MSSVSVFGKKYILSRQHSSCSIFRPSISTTLSSSPVAVSPSTMWEATASFQASNESNYERSDLWWQQLTMGIAFVFIARSTATSTACDADGVAIDPPAQNDSKSGKEPVKPPSEGEPMSQNSAPISEPTKPQQLPQLDPKVLNRISKRTLQTELWFGELAREPQTLKRYQEFLSQHPELITNGGDDDVVVNTSMTKPDILGHIAQRLIDMEGWGILPDLIPLVVEQLEVAGVPKYTKEELVTFYNIMRMESLILIEAGPCLPFFRALHECVMTQPPNVDAPATTTTTRPMSPIAQWMSPSTTPCPLHVNMMEQCLAVNENLVQLVSNQREFDAMLQEMRVPAMIRKADKVEWTRPPFKLDLTPWIQYVQVRGWSADDVEKRLQAERQWRKDTFFNSNDNSSNNGTIRCRGQPYWEHVQYEWNDIAVLTLQVDLPRVDPATGYRLVKAWACDADMPQPQIVAAMPSNDDKEPEEKTGEQQKSSPSSPRDIQPPPLILGLRDGNPSVAYRRGRNKETIPLSVTVLAERTEAIQVYALYAEYKTAMNADKARLYHTQPLSLMKPLLK